MSETDKSFAFLQKSIPQWLQDVARIEKKVTAMQEQVTKVSISVSPFKKSDSIESIRPVRLRAITEDNAPSRSAQTDPARNHKRKTPSVVSGRASGPSHYRPKQMVVMDYDGDMQKSFELLVRVVGTGRNMLRKARMEAKMNELAALAGSSDEEEEADDDDEEEVMVSKISYRPRMSSMRARAAARRGGRPGATGVSTTPVELIDTTDKTLEAAQGLCEKAAHLTLRDGDCRKELAQVRQDFEQVLETANTEMVKCNTRQLQESQESPPQDASDTSISSVEPPYKDKFSSIRVPTPERTPPKKDILPDAPKSITPAIIPPKAIDIEVDEDEEDEEDEDVNFVMPPVRLMSRLTPRV